MSLIKDVNQGNEKDVFTKYLINKQSFLNGNNINQEVPGAPVHPWRAFWNSDHEVLKLSIRSLALPCSEAV